MFSPLRPFSTSVLRAFALFSLMALAISGQAKADDTEKFSCAGTYDDWWVVISPTPRSPAADASEHEISVPVVPVHWTGSWPKGLRGAWGWRVPLHTCITPILPQPMVDASCPQGWMTVSITKDAIYQRSPRDEAGKLIPTKEYVLDSDQTAVQICSAYLGRVKHLQYASSKLPDSCYGPSPNWMNVGWYFAREDDRPAKMYDHVMTVPTSAENGGHQDWIGYREVTRPVYGKARNAIYATRCPYAGIGYVPGWAGNSHNMYGSVSGLPNQTAAYEVKVDIGFKSRFQKYGNYYNIYFPGFDRGLNNNPPVVHTQERNTGVVREQLVETPTGARYAPQVMGTDPAGLHQAYGYARTSGNYAVTGADSLAVRAAASVNSQKIGTLYSGARVQVSDGQGKVGPGCRSGAWLRIYHERGTGFVCSLYLRPIQGGNNYQYNSLPKEGGSLWGAPGRVYQNNRGPESWWSNYLPYVTQPMWSGFVPGGQPGASVEVQRELTAMEAEKKTN